VLGNSESVTFAQKLAA